MNKTYRPLISVVIPSYNHGAYLRRALQSVTNQTYDNWECIVVDNNSKDDTDRIIEENLDHRIIFYKVNNEGIIAKSRNIGIESSHGEWIAFLDSDDWWGINKLEVCVKKINEKVDLIYHDVFFSTEENQLFSNKKIKSRTLRKPYEIDLLLNGNTIVNSSVLVKKNALLRVKNFSESMEMVGCEDYNGWIKIAQLGGNFLHINESLGYYFNNSSGISKKDMSIPAEKSIMQFFYLLNNKQIKIVKSNLMYMKARYYLRHKKFYAAKNYLSNSMTNGAPIIKIKSVILIFYIYIKNLKIYEI